MAVSSRIVTGQQFGAWLSDLHPALLNLCNPRHSILGKRPGLVADLKTVAPGKQESRSADLADACGSKGRRRPEIQTGRYVRAESSANWLAAGKINGKV